MKVGVGVWGLLVALMCSATPSAAETFRVKAGEAIGPVIEAAPAGSVIEVEPGVYKEELSVDQPGITLRGIVRGNERPVLEGEGSRNDGVIASGSPFSMTGFQIQHYKGNGVTVQGADGVYLSDLIIDDTGWYGVYPVGSKNITITHTTVTGIVDAGIYVGESVGALVAYNDVHHNVAGIEIENTNDAIVRDNLVWENSAGILAFVLPNKMLKEAQRIRIERNWVVRNNTPNFGDKNAIVGSLPHGIGLMVMGADRVELVDNWVKYNDSAGIALVRLAPEHAQKDPALEPFADAARVRFNYMLANGRSPHETVAKNFGGGGDLVWDGTGRDNCADLEDAVIRRGAPLASCLDAQDSEPPAAGPSPAEHGHDATAPQGATAAVPAQVEPLPEGAAVVRIRGMRYEPRHIEVRVGQPVVWINEDGVPHTVTSGEGLQATGAPLSSPFLQRGERYTHSFGEVGRYEYLCLPHVNQAPMRGATVRVVAGDAAGAGAPAAQGDGSGDADADGPAVAPH